MCSSQQLHKQAQTCLARCLFIHFGIRDSFSVHLLPNIGKTELKLEHSVMLIDVSAQSFTPVAILHHAQQMFKLALQIGLNMFDKGLIAISADSVKLYVYDDGDAYAIVNTEDISATNISSVIFTPKMVSMGCMPAGLVKAKASSAGGIMSKQQRSLHLRCFCAPARS